MKNDPLLEIITKENPRDGVIGLKGFLYRGQKFCFQKLMCWFLLHTVNTVHKDEEYSLSITPDNLSQLLKVKFRSRSQTIGIS